VVRKGSQIFRAQCQRWFMAAERRKNIFSAACHSKKKAWKYLGRKKRNRLSFHNSPLREGQRNVLGQEGPPGRGGNAKNTGRFAGRDLLNWKQKRRSSLQRGQGPRKSKKKREGGKNVREKVTTALAGIKEKKKPTRHLTVTGGESHHLLQNEKRGTTRKKAMRTNEQDRMGENHFAHLRVTKRKKRRKARIQAGVRMKEKI